MWGILENPLKFIENPSKINPKRSQIQKNTSLDRFRHQIAPRSAPGRGTWFLDPFWPKMAFQGAILGPSWGPKSVKNRTFGFRSAQGPSKNELRKGVGKKHENLMKHRCRNGWSLMARNHVWRYTLRLFHTFAIFEKS